MLYLFSWKRLKQRLKIKRKLYLASKLLFVFILGVVTLTGYLSSIAFGAQSEAMNIDDVSNWLNKDEQIQAIYHRKYVCGDEIKHLGELSYEEVITLAHENSNWELTVDQSHTLISFVEEVNDLSPYCKQNAYFGVNDDGEFTLFDGEPSNDKVIKTFFQLNLPYLESSLPEKELKHLLIGIRVKDIEEYESVLSTFSEFSIDRSSNFENVMGDTISQ